MLRFYHRPLSTILRQRPLPAPGRFRSPFSPLRTSESLRLPVVAFSTQVERIPRKCPSCHQPLPTSIPACTNCWFIAGLPSDISYHELLGLPEDTNPFSIDTAALKSNFRRAQQVCHPDSWASKGEGKQDLAHSLSSLVNNAYQRLLKPLTRAEYILERNGHTMSEEDKLDDMIFISEVMEAREEIENADNPVLIQAIREENRGKISDMIDEIESLIEAKDWAAVKEATIRLKYLEGIERAAHAHEDAHS
ncbi:Co-chaperone Hsc20 [Pleurotus eryngii]|uniref:Co-chaperone Hsc20 n=1 Tax=Pleurotus eryngii TaxID=5323 RepID=A0A9P6DGM1_PLEER|nr:Co-chaperone Hsc20 [Pleurotus eryngii]